MSCHGVGPDESAAMTDSAGADDDPYCSSVGQAKRAPYFFFMRWRMIAGVVAPVLLVRNKNSRINANGLGNLANNCLLLIKQIESFGVMS